MQVLDGHISTFSNNDTRNLFCIVKNACCQLLSFIIVRFIVHLFVDFHAVFYSMRLFCSIRFCCSVSSSPSKYSVLILDCIPGISILLNIIIKQVNTHHASDCTVFVLVQERVAYYHHRHRRDIQNQYSPNWVSRGQDNGSQHHRWFPAAQVLQGKELLQLILLTSGNGTATAP